MDRNLRVGIVVLLIILISVFAITKLVLSDPDEGIVPMLTTSLQTF
jgi:hypothetical protein